MQPIIKIENLSKMYRLGLVGRSSLNDDFKRWFYRIRGLENPFLKVGETNERSSKGSSEYVWALKDINLEVMPGEVLGIIGKNGAGKSTLLKILSKVTGPTTGAIHYNGRIGSLLEVGTGFHPELTGRENIFLNGAILGMSKAEIRSKLDEIIDFSGIERYIDTPVKRYSSGMMVRLGFAVAAHLEPEILVVDEVLAVGDAEFQKKAIGKMQDVSRNDGRTVLFVSHNMVSIQKLCTTTIIMENGSIVFNEDTEKAIAYYLQSSLEKSNEKLGERKDREGGKNFRFIDVKVINQKGIDLDLLQSGIKCKFEIYYKVETDVVLKNVRMLIVDNNSIVRILCNTALVNKTPKKFSRTNKDMLSFSFVKFPLPKGSYNLRLTSYSDNGVEDDIESAFNFDVEGGDFYGNGKQAYVKDGVLVEFEAEC